MLKAHKYWSIGAFICMLLAMISGHDKSLRGSHKYWALGAFGCMVMSVYTGHKMIHKKPETAVSKKSENEEEKGDQENG